VPVRAWAAERAQPWRPVASCAMSIKARLRGDSFDLSILAELFPSPNDPAVGVDDGGYYLTSAALGDDLVTDGGAMHAAAASLLRQVNGAARLMSGSFRTVELAGHFTDGSGRQHAVALAGCAEARAHVSAVVGPSPVPPAAPGYVQLADKHPEVREVLEILGKPGPTLDWFDLYKVYEIVGDHVASGPDPAKRQSRQNALINTGWVSKEDLSAFTGSADRPDVSGDAARHARMPGDPPKRTMSIEDARLMIAVLVRRWLESL
jgi:hypothetical protein